MLTSNVRAADQETNQTCRRPKDYNRIRQSDIALLHRLCVLVVACCGVVVPAVAEDHVLSGDEIIERFVDVSGGRGAYAKIRNRVVLAKLDIPDHGWEGELAELFVPPDFRRVVTIDAYDPIVNGVNDGTPWQRTPLGTRSPLGRGGELGQAQAADIVRHAQLTPFLDRTLESGEARVVSDGAINGDECYRVEVLHSSEPAIYAYFSKKTGLLRRIDNSLIRTVRYFDDYRKHDGILIPHKVQIHVGMIMMDLGFLRIEQNIELADLDVDNFFQTIEEKDIPEILGIAEDGSLQTPLD